MLSRHRYPFTRGALVALAALFPALPAAVSCGGSDHDTNAPQYVGQKCSAPADCYPGIAASTLHGEVACLDQSAGGYCTHLCQTDADCCAVHGECKGGHVEVCSPFESTGKMYCFLSCESAQVGSLDPTVYCQTYGHPDFTCRSTGGGANNRKICGPG